jgi:hypothetical protein
MAVLLLSGVLCAAEIRADYYVAVNGDDAWSGRLAARNSQRTDGPFRTPDCARRAVRAMRRANDLPRPVTVLIRGGTYFLNEPLSFEPEDSGTTASPITYAAYPGEKPVLSGGVRLGGFTRDGKGWWRAKLPAAQESGDSPLSLYVNGQRRYRPRLPRQGSYRIAGSVPLDPGDSTKPCAFEFAPGSVRPDWANLGDVEVLTIHIWNMSRMRVRDVETTSGIVRFTGGLFARDGNWSEFAVNYPYYVENVKEALGRPGDFYFDRTLRELTYVPMPGEQPGSTEVIAPRLAQIIRIAGDPRQGRFIRNLHFRGLTFAHSNWSMPPGGHHFPQSDSILQGAVIAEGARGCSFGECRFVHTGAYALQFDLGCRDNVVEGSDFSDLGAGGVKIGFWAPGEPPDCAVSHNMVRNNTFAHGGRVQPGGTAVVVGTSHHNVIEHNDIYDFYYMGVSLGYTWEENVSARDNAVRDNHIHHMGQGALSDMGAIYTLGLSPGTRIEHNLIHDVRDAWYGGWGIYLDALSSEIEVRNNIVYRTAAGALHLNRGQGNVVENNILALGDEAQLVRSSPHQKPSMHFRNNIVYWRDAFLLASNWDGFNYEFDGNLYWDATRRPVRFGTLDFDQWQSHGLDRHSLIADPLFANPRGGDFRLAANSPAFAIGFAAIDGQGFGRIGAPADPESAWPLPAYPDLSRAEPLCIDFEDMRVGGKPHYAGVFEGGENARIRVTTETALTGRQSLAFTDDSTTKPGYLPFMTQPFKVVRGTAKVRFALRMMPGGVFRHEWRDIVKEGMHGPSLLVAGMGDLSVGGRVLERLPMNKWVWLEIECRVGPGAPGDFSVKVRQAGRSRGSEYRHLKGAGGFDRLMALFFISEGETEGRFFLDDISASVVD